MVLGDFGVTLARRLATALLLAFAATAVRAQSTGGLRVRVIDNADKSPVVGASVTISSATHLVPTTTIVTDAKGVANFPVLRVGAGYVVTVIMDGYAGVREDASVAGDTSRDMVVALAPEHVEKITIIEERQVIDLDQSEASTKFSADFIQDLPVAGRFYQNVLALAPGVQDPDGDGNPNVNGARERDFKATVGGISNVDPLTGQYLNLVNTDSIEDLTVVTAGAGAEYGRAQGGFAQIVQKQGSNEFEGIFGMIFSSHFLDGNGSTGLPQQYLPDFHLYQPSLQVSGPIIRDKLWYRLSQEYIDRVDPFVLATGGSVAAQGTKQFSTDNQLTWQVTNRNKLAFSFRSDPKTLTNVGVSPVVPVSSTEQYKLGGPTYAVTWTAPYSPSLLVDSTVAYQDSHLDITPTETGVPNNCVGPGYLDRSQCFNALDGTTSGTSTRSWFDRRQRLTVKSDATYYKGRLWGAQHQLKFGFIVENERYSRTLERTPSFVQDGFYDPFAHGIIYNFTLTASLEPESFQNSVGTTSGVYGEDVIRPVSNLSITIGARIEQETIGAHGFQPFDPQAEADAYIAAIRGLTPVQRSVYLQHAFTGYEDVAGALTAIQTQLPEAQFFDSAYSTQIRFWQKFRRKADIALNNTNISPRLALAWDPWDNGKGKLSASAGRYYDKIFLAIPASESEPILATFPVTFRINQAFAPSFNYTTVDRNLKTPYQDEWSIAFEHEIFTEATLSVRYIHRSFKDQVQDVQTNQAPNDFGRCQLPLNNRQASLIPSPGTGPVVDPYTGETYEDTDPGDGDGRIDDCIGIRVPFPNGPGGHNPPTYQRGDGIPDLYVINPGWGDIFKIGNYNHAQYDGVTLEFVRRQYKNWEMEASYTWSRATGNGEDYNLLLGDDVSTLQDEAGYQSYDIRHSFKLNATTIVPWGGIRLGGAVQYRSGLPYSLLQRSSSEASSPPIYPVGQDFTSVRTVYLTGRRNDQRNAPAWNFDAKIVKEFALKKAMNLQLTGEIFNLFGENTYVIYNNTTKSGQQINGTNDAYRRFGRQYQLGMRLSF